MSNGLKTRIPPRPVVVVQNTERLDSVTAKVSTEGGTDVTACGLAVSPCSDFGRRCLDYGVVFSTAL